MKSGRTKAGGETGWAPTHDSIPDPVNVRVVPD